MRSGRRKMKQGSAEQLAENERRCKWSATLAALARVPVGATIEFPHIALSETNRLRAILHTSGRTSGFRWSVSTKTGVIRVSKLGHCVSLLMHNAANTSNKEGGQQPAEQNLYPEKTILRGAAKSRSE